MLTGMGKHSMTSLRERRAALGLVQMNLWIREEDRAAFTAAVEPFKQRAGEMDPAQPPGRKRHPSLFSSNLPAVSTPSKKKKEEGGRKCRVETC